MPDISTLFAFGLIALGMVLTPGPNMIYLVSRSICQGRQAGFISLAGVALGFVFYMLCAAFGITAFIFAIPYAYDVLRVAGAMYLLYLAWQTVKPNGRSAFQLQTLDIDSPRKLFLMGFLTNIANPKIAIMYLSLLPQFITPDHGSVLLQSMVLGSTQILISITINGLIVITAGAISLLLTRRPTWQLIQRWLMGTVLAGLAINILVESRK